MCIIKKKQLKFYEPTTVKHFELRLVDNADKDSIFDYPVVFRGTWFECEKYAKKEGYHWKKSSGLFKGYWVKENGNCLYPT